MSGPCAGTPQLTVRDNRGLGVRTLRYNRESDVAVSMQRIDATMYDSLGHVASMQDARFFSGKTFNFQFAPALSGQVLQTVSADAGTSKACVDVAGQPIWRDSQGRDANLRLDNHITMRLYYDALGRKTQCDRYTSTTLGAEAVGGASDFWCYGDTTLAGGASYDPNDVSDLRNANQRGKLLRHFDTAGVLDMNALGYGLQAPALREDRYFLSAVCDPNNTWTAADLRIAYSTNQKLESSPYCTRRNFNALGRTLVQLDAKGHHQRTSYDCAGLRYSTSFTPDGGSPTPVTAAITYSPVGEVATRSDANGIRIAHTYEPQISQRLVSITATRGSATLQALVYGYDGVGNVLALSDGSAQMQVSFFRNRATTGDRTFTYDALYQLVSASGRENYVDNTPKGTDWPGDGFLPSSRPDYRPYTRSYTYDLGGNLRTIGSADWCGATPATREMVVGDASNRAVCTANCSGPTAENIDDYFDGAGKNICLDGNVNRPLYWTAFHQLYCVVNTYRVPANGAADWSNSDCERYAYDGSGQRVRKYGISKTGTTWNCSDARYLPGLELRSNSGTGENLEVIVLDDGARVLRWAGDSGRPSDIPDLQLRYQYCDRQKSCQIETDKDGNVIAQEEYFPYGGTAVLASSTASEVKYKFIRYSGKERDATGLYYYGMRYYEPWTGRWISPDAAGNVDGQNLYRMVRNNPVTLQDARGAAAEDVDNVESNPDGIIDAGIIAMLSSLASRTTSTLAIHHADLALQRQWGVVLSALDESHEAAVPQSGRGSRNDVPSEYEARDMVAPSIAAKVGLDEDAIIDTLENFGQSSSGLNLYLTNHAAIEPAGSDDLATLKQQARDAVRVFDALPPSISSSESVRLYHRAKVEAAHGVLPELEQSDILVNLDFISFTENPYALAKLLELREGHDVVAQESEAPPTIYVLDAGTSARAFAPFSYSQRESESTVPPGAAFQVQSVDHVNYRGASFTQVRIDELALDFEISEDGYAVAEATDEGMLIGGSRVLTFNDRRPFALDGYAERVGEDMMKIIFRKGYGRMTGSPKVAR